MCMAFIALWLTVLSFLWTSAVQCDAGLHSLDDTCALDSPLVSLRQLLVKSQKAKQSHVDRRSALPATCAEGRLLPEVYLLGAPKCGTTELADDLMQSGIHSVAG
eukprot:6146677-Amphidinium_carterae.1